MQEGMEARRVKRFAEGPKAAWGRDVIRTQIHPVRKSWSCKVTD